MTAAVFGLAGPICEVELARDSTGRIVKEAIERQTEGAWKLATMRLLLGTTEVKDGRNLGDLLDPNAGHVSLTLLKGSQFDGTYEAKPHWNSEIRFTIAGSTVFRVGQEQDVAEVLWDESNPRKCTFTLIKYGSSEWAHRKTEGGHKAEDGLKETFSIEFLSDDAKDAFQGRFQRQYEGPLHFDHVRWIG